MVGIESIGAVSSLGTANTMQNWGGDLGNVVPPGAMPMVEPTAFNATAAIDRAPAVGASEGIGTQLTRGLQVLHDNVKALQTEAVAAASVPASLRGATPGVPGPAALGAATGEATSGIQIDAANLSDPMRAYLAASAEQRALTLKTAIHALAIDVAHATATSVKSSVDKLMQG